MGVIILNGDEDKRCGFPRRMAKRLADVRLSNLNSRGITREEEMQEFSKAVKELEKSDFTFFVSVSLRSRLRVGHNAELAIANLRTDPDLARFGSFCGTPNSAAITHSEIFER